MEIAPFMLLLFAGGIRLAVPLMAAALGETFAQRSGVLSVGIEGYMGFAAAISFLGSYYSGSAWFGLLMGMAAGGLLSLIHAYFSVTRGLDQIVSGLGLMFLGLGGACFVRGLAIFWRWSVFPLIKTEMREHYPEEKYKE